MRIFEHNRCQCAKSDTFQSHSFVMLCEHCKRCLKCILFHFTLEFCKLLHQAGPLSWFSQFFVLSFDCNSILCYRQYPPIVSDLYPLHFSEYNHVECEPCRSSTRTRTSASKMSGKSNRLHIVHKYVNKRPVKHYAKNFVGREGHSRNLVRCTCHLSRCATFTPLWPV